MSKLTLSDSVEASVQKIFESIRVIESKTPFQLLDVLHNLKDDSDTFAPSLLVVDSLDTLFGSLFKPGYSLDATFYLNCVSTQLKLVAKCLGAAVIVITNCYESQFNRISNLFNYPNWVALFSRNQILE